MESFWDFNFLVVDVETNGSNPQKDRIIDIGCVLLNNSQVVTEFSSLINPHQHIPLYIQKMTGITNELAFNSPECESVFTKFNQLINENNTIFVAHNTAFDWSFISSTYQRLGWQVPKIPRLCTLKLARRLFPGNIKKGLDSLSSIFKISIQNRHRALGDAKATALILLELLERSNFEHDITTIEQLIQFQNSRIKNYQLNKTTLKKFDKIVKSLPEEPGIYYFKDKSDKIIYIGKAKSLKDRVKSYFSPSGQTSRKINKLIKKIDKIDFVCTDTELSALLLESKEIKKYKPEFNSMELRYRKFPFLKLTTNEKFPVLEICFNIDNLNAEYYGPFRSRFLAEEILELCRKKFKLRKCEKMPKPHPDNISCLYYQIDRCLAPCAMIENVEKYNDEIQKIREFLSGNNEGIIATFQNKMFEHSTKLEYESASLIKSKINDIMKVFGKATHPNSSINDYNQILILPASNKYKTIEFFLIRNGKLVSQLVLGRKASTQKLRKQIHDIYFNGFTSSLFFTNEDIDDIRIISSWLNRQSDIYQIQINGKSFEEVISRIEFIIKNIPFH